MLDSPLVPALRASRKLVALLCFIALPAHALAGAHEAPRASPSEVAAAQALFEQGRVLIRQGRAREACPKLEESQRLDPGVGTQFNLASCYEQLGKLASAYALFTEVAATAHSTGQAQRERVARARAEAVRPKLTKLAIVVPAGVEGAIEIERDGVAVGTAQWGFPVPVDPGRHRVTASGPGVGVWATNIDVPSDGAVHSVTIPRGAEVGFFAPLNHKLAVVAAGVGVVGLGVGGGFALHALAKKQEADATGCRGKECQTPQGVELRERASNAGDVATVGVTIGVVGLAAAAALLWVVPELGREDSGDAERQNATLDLTPILAPDACAMLVSLQF
ncbi:MAG: tetratricopeptide repeat protein [Deltaproteobacteria bacterium]